MNMSINVLPSEILHTVLTIYAKDVKDILHFSSVCKEWKETVDHSELWLTMELSFYCPAHYFKLCRADIYHLNLPDLELEKIRVANAAPVFIDIAVSDDVPLLARRYKVIADRGKLLEQLRFSPSTIASKKQIETCNLIRSKFFNLKRQYNQQWAWYCQWMPWINQITNFSQIITTKEFLLIFLGLNFICKTIAFVCLTTIPTHYTYLDVIDHVGFGALYFNEFLHIMIGIAGICYVIGNSFQSTKFLDCVPIRLTPALPFLVIICAALGIFGALLCFHLCLSSNLSTTYYPLITIPLWVFSLLIVSCWTAYNFRDELPREERGSLSYFTILFIPPAFTLFSFTFNDFYITSMVVSMLPFLLAEVTFLHSVWRSMCEVFNEAKVIASLESVTSLHFFRMYLLFIKSFLMISCVIIGILFHVFLFMHDYNLSKGFGLGVLWYLFFESAILIRLFLFFHLT